MIGAAALADPGGLIATAFMDTAGLDTAGMIGVPAIAPPLLSSWTSARMDGGDVAFQLGTGYQLQLTALERNLLLIDLARDTRTTITYDARMLTDAGAVGDFYGPISLELGDGTLVTITTEAAMVADATAKTTIKGFVATRDAMAMEVASLIDALSDPVAATRVSANGDDVDEAQRDGLVLVQDRDGWVQEDGAAAADAAYLAQTAPDGPLGAAGEWMSGREAGRAIHRIIASSWFSQSFSSTFRTFDTRGAGEDRSRHATDRAAIRLHDMQRMAEQAAIQRHMIFG